MATLQKARARADFARQHLEALHTGSKVTRWFRQEREPNMLEVTPENVIGALHRAGIRCVLMGTHGINGYRDEARATSDVDVLVPKKDVRKAVRIMEQEFPYLEIEENSAVARFRNPASQKILIDVMKPSSEAMKLVFRYAVAIGRTHRIPDLEMALVSKYLAMFAPNRKAAKRQVDAGDFANIFSTNRRSVDVEKLKRLLQITSLDRGKELPSIIEDIDNDRPIKLS
jgi:predicted nucleotidyltransferase